MTGFTGLLRARRGLLLAGLGGFALAALATLPAWQQTERARVGAEQARLGDVLADRLAAAAEDPLLRQDRVALGVVAHRMAARAEVGQAAIRAADGQPLALAGTAPRPGVAVFSAPVVLADTVAAQAEVTIAADALTAPAISLWAAVWPFWAAGVALAAVAILLGGTQWRGSRRATSDGTTAPAQPETTVTGWVIVQLAALAAPAGEREQALKALAALSPRVARLYGAQAWPLRQGGLALEFSAEPARDRHFNMVCAALLLRRALARCDLAPDGRPAQPASGMFRFAVDDAATPAPTDAAAIEAQANVLARLANAAGDVVIGAAALTATQGRERLRLADADADAAGAVVRGTAPDYEALLDAQAASITA